MSQIDNLFERYEIDPAAGPEAITERLRELAEGADEAERDVLRAAWERLTMHPDDRLEQALRAFPESRAPLGSPPRTLRATHASRTPAEAVATLGLRDLAYVPSVAAALDPEPAPPVLPLVSDDPLLCP